MKRRAPWIIAAVNLLIICGSFGIRALASAAEPRSRQPDLAYALHGTLWLRSLSGGVAWQVRTPLPVSGISWSPDGGALAFAGSMGIGVVAVNGHDARMLFSRRLGGYRYGQEPPLWSPNGRYLIFTANMRDQFTLLDDWIWDRKTGRARLLARAVLSDFNSRFWANDSSRVAIGVHQSHWSRPPAWRPVAEIIDVQDGAVRRLGKGDPGPWSPDDRFIGFDRLWGCGATGCLFQEGILPSSGGRFTILTRLIHTGDANEVWVHRPHGYAYDRWLLDRRGRILRRIPGRYVNVESWSPDGRWVAVRSLTPSFRIALTLVSARTLRSARIYISRPTDGCDACVHQGYDVRWNRSSTAFALLTPCTYCDEPNGVKPSLYVYTVASSHSRPGLSGGLKIGVWYPRIVGWIDHDRQLLIYVQRTLLRFVPGQARLVPLVHGLPSIDDPLFGDSAELRPGV